jgi:LPXTG-motif cell wall-anchored protein
MPPTRRLTTLAGAALVGAATTAMFAAPANATGNHKYDNDAEATHEATCDTEKHLVKLVVKVKNKHSQKASLVNAHASLQLGQKHVNDVELAELKNKEVPAKDRDHDGEYRDALYVTPGSTVKLNLLVSWTAEAHDSSATANVDLTITTKGVCKPEDENQSPAAPVVILPAPNAPAAPAAPAQPVAAKSSAPAASLPVTGAQTGLYAGGAAVLLAAGGGLFLVARRRRVKFEA